MKRIAILQSNYIPWKGYFDIIDLVDEFIILDAKYTHRDWRNRNRIKTKDGLQWLTVPVECDGWISEAIIADPKAMEKHWKAIQCAYGKAPMFKKYADRFRSVYETPFKYLCDLNSALIGLICEIFEITTPITDSDCYPSREHKARRLVDICKQAGATHYLSGPAAKNYLDESFFKGIEVEWMSYSYPEYPQLHGDFVHEVSILDLLFNVGPDKSLWRSNADIRRG